ncbi:Protein of unknown function [Thalassolituus maritimus]|uniref:DUF3592 domain-containing protein n=1 Tax=Thalassolituus maritimus TaxID=484498 RepID=A0A1N7J2V1_9GAMM|nr:DUF3592 domain-containing protein [Thalassolituus maritimus]SIS43670.1 Protein of unknown function [Thalassolituus maritimus]
MSISKTGEAGTTSKRSIGTFIFGLMFLGPALGLFLFGPLDTLRLHVMTSGWTQIPATLQRIDIEYHHGDTTTYSLEGLYSYRVNGLDYSSSRISYDESPDNIGDWHATTESKIRRASASQALTAWVNPDNPSESYLVRDIRWEKIGFMMIFVLVFGGAGAGIMLFGRYSARQADVASGVVYSGQNLMHWVLGFMSMVFLLISLPAVLSVPSEFSAGNHAILLVLLFPLVAAGLGLAAYRSRKNWLFYGRTPLYLNPVPGQVQGQVGGTLKINKTGLGESWNVRLKCVSQTRSSGKKSSTRETLLWQSSTLPEVTESNDETCLNFVFNPDPELPQSYRKGRKAVIWRVEVEGPTEPVKFQRQFVVPVVEGAANSTLDISTEHQSKASRSQVAAAEASLSQNLDMTLSGDDFVIHSAAGRHLSFFLVFMFAGIAFAGAGVFMFKQAATEGVTLYFMGGIFFLVGAPMALGGLFGLGRSLESRCEDGKIETVRYWMGRALWRRSTEFRSAQQLELKAAGSSSTGNSTKEYFHIRIRDGQRKVRIAEMIEGREAAELLMDRLRASLISDELIG